MARARGGAQWHRHRQHQALVTEGLEGGVPTRRVIQGGTGNCTGARGEVVQETLGESAGGLFNHRFTFRFTHLPRKCMR